MVNEKYMLISKQGNCFALCLVRRVRKSAFERGREYWSFKRQESNAEGRAREAREPDSVL